MKIRFASDHPAYQQAGGYPSFIVRTFKSRWGITFEVAWDEARGTIPAQIIRSSWVVQCPFCNDAVFAQPPFGFFCPNCGMVANKHKPMAVIYPENALEIERLLLLRPVPETRNWFISESVDDLRRENATHGVGV